LQTSITPFIRSGICQPVKSTKKTLIRANVLTLFVSVRRLDIKFGAAQNTFDAEECMQDA